MEIFLYTVWKNGPGGHKLAYQNEILERSFKRSTLPTDKFFEDNRQFEFLMKSLQLANNFNSTTSSTNCLV